ncbi:MAG: aspartate aminotransferase family protein [Planctomycetaceae bacterium]
MATAEVTDKSFVIEFAGEVQSNQVRQTIGKSEPHSLRTFTPSQAVLAKSAGVFHWTPEGRRLYDYSSGVLVANLGHNPRRWLRRFHDYLGWPRDLFSSDPIDAADEFVPCVSMTAYNAMTKLEADASRRLLDSLQSSPGGNRLQSVMWSASGSEAVQKALWACMRRNPDRPEVLATRFGFHGKKGLAEAVTGSEKDPERDPRVRFISFPREECSDIDLPDQPFDAAKYQAELQSAWDASSGRISCLITEPYLGGGGSYHPPAEYLQLLQRFCRQHDILFILDEVQSNFGRTGRMYAFEAYGLEPDFVCLGKGLGNGVPVSAAVGRRDVCDRMKYGETSDTWSGNPISCAAVLATLDEFEAWDVPGRTRQLSTVFADGLRRLKETGVIARVRGEGMVFGIECGSVGKATPNEVANAVIERCYRGDERNDGIHLLGTLAGCVIRISPPMCITDEQAEHSLNLLHRFVSEVGETLRDERA